MRTVSSCFALFLLLASCGGGAATPGPAKSAEGPEAAAREQAGSAEESEDTSGSPAASEAPKGPSCDDGTCSVCGSSICPSGWYCDEKSSACSWLTECAEKPSCGCVTRVLGSACKCREEGGGLKVACD